MFTLIRRVRGRGCIPGVNDHGNQYISFSKSLKSALLKPIS